jgi:hypothetical protein
MNTASTSERRGDSRLATLAKRGDIASFWLLASIATAHRLPTVNSSGVPKLNRFVTQSVGDSPKKAILHADCSHVVGPSGSRDSRSRTMKLT